MILERIALDITLRAIWEIDYNNNSIINAAHSGGLVAQPGHCGAKGGVFRRR